MSEKTTSELSAYLMCDPNLIRKWKRRGFLKLAPQGIRGQGAGNECYWSIEAQEELIDFARTRNYGYKSAEQRLSTPTRKNSTTHKHNG